MTKEEKIERLEWLMGELEHLAIWKMWKLEWEYVNRDSMLLWQESPEYRDSVEVQNSLDAAEEVFLQLREEM